VYSRRTSTKKKTSRYMYFVCRINVHTNIDVILKLWLIIGLKIVCIYLSTMPYYKKIVLWNDVYHHLCWFSIHSYQFATSQKITILNSQKVQILYCSLPHHYKLQYNLELIVSSCRPCKLVHHTHSSHNQSLTISITMELIPKRPLSYKGQLEIWASIHDVNFHCEFFELFLRWKMY
jgi:hypothetical protein